LTLVRELPTTSRASSAVSMERYGNDGVKPDEKRVSAPGSKTCSNPHRYVASAV